ncbi:unnamed protein product [Arabidopsis halleri]
MPHRFTRKTSTKQQNVIVPIPKTRITYRPIGPTQYKFNKRRPLSNGLLLHLQVINRVLSDQNNKTSVLKNKFDPLGSVLYSNVRRSPSGRESLVIQRTVGKTKDAAVVIVSEIPLAFLAGEEICSGYVANVLSKKGINSSVKNQIIPKICQDAINMSRRLGEEETKSFLVEAEVEVTKESSHSTRKHGNLLSLDDYDSQGQRIPRVCNLSRRVNIRWAEEDHEVALFPQFS